MCAKWKRDPSQIIRELNRCRSQSSGKVTYRGFAIEPLQTTLTSFVQFNKTLHESQRSRVVAAALNTPTRNERISKDSLLRSITARELSYLRRPTRHFVLVTSMSFKGKVPFQKIRLLNAQIIFRTNFEKFDRTNIKKLTQGQIFGRWPQDYTPVAVRTEARSESEAGPLAQDALDLLRSIWNLQLNTKFRMSFGRTQPVNAIRLGPFHTLHDVTGQPTSSQYWYEPDYLDPGKTTDITSHRNILRDQTIKVRRRFKKSPISEDLRTALLRYTRALDGWNLDNSFRQLWGTLEFLTNSYKHEVIARRAAFLYSDFQLALDIASHLRVRRNISVHSNETHPDVETLTYQLKNFVENLLVFYLQNPFQLRSREEISTMLDLPPMAADLRRRLRLVQSALKYRTP